MKALAAVYRTGQRFGAGHVIDVLLGKDTEKVISFDHQKLQVFGAGKDVDKHTWQSVFRQLMAAGYLVADADAFNALKLTEAARPVFKGEQKITLRRDAPKPPRLRDIRKQADGRDARSPRRRCSRRCGRSGAGSRGSSRCRPT